MLYPAGHMVHTQRMTGQTIAKLCLPEDMQEAFRKMVWE